MAIVNVGDFSAPLLQSEIVLPGSSVSVAIEQSANIAIVAGSVGVHLVDVSDPVVPVLIDTIELPGGAQSVEIIDGVAYVASSNRLVALDPLTSERLEDLSIGSGSIVDLTREGSFLYVLSANGNVTVVDASAFSMVLRGNTSSGLGSANSLFVGNGIAYIGRTGFQEGFATIDVTDPDAPVLLSGADDGAIGGTSVVTNGSGLAIAVGTPGGASGGNASIWSTYPSRRIRLASFLEFLCLPLHVIFFRFRTRLCSRGERWFADCQLLPVRQSWSGTASQHHQRRYRRGWRHRRHSGH